MGRAGEARSFFCVFVKNRYLCVMKVDAYNTPDLTMPPYGFSEPSSSLVDRPEKSFAQAARECGAISVDDFFDEVRRQQREHYEKLKHA
jgi:hypothetical protein